MMDDPEVIISGQIEDLERQLAEKRSMLQAVRDSKKKMGMANRRFFNMRPVDAAREVLRERGKKIPRDELVQILLAGGIGEGRKNPMVNIRRSFEDNVKLGNLLKDGEYIDLPENSN